MEKIALLQRISLYNKQEINYMLFYFIRHISCHYELDLDLKNQL